MPVIEVSKRDLCSLIGKNLNTNELSELLSFAKATLESESGDMLKIEAGDVNRPDLWSSEGIARIIKGQLGKEIGLPKYTASKSNYILKVESKVAKARPLIVCAVVKNLRLDEASINQIIQLQEKLCENFGLKRKEAALGIYDFDRIKWPITYTTFKPNELKFVPLDMNGPLALNEILQKHEKGRQYSHLLANCKEYPILIDAAKEVLSMPPIINSNLTGKVTEKTKNVFVEVTGFSYQFIVPVLNIMVSALAERGGKIEQVSIHGNNKIATPDLSPKSFSAGIDYCNKIIGLELNARQMCDLLKKARFDAKQDGNKIIAYYLPYRQDIMDERDIIEDIAIAYGYDKLAPEEARIPTTGKAAGLMPIKKRITEMLVGLNMQEIATFTLTSRNNLSGRMHLENGNAIEIANPISENYSCIRNSLIPSVLEFLSQNTKKEFPQKIFEIGECYDLKEEKTKDKLVVAITHSKVNFTEMKQILDYIMKNLNVKCGIKEVQHQSFIEGRAGSVIINNAKAGIIGEIHPKVISSWNLEMPVSVLELDFDALH